MARAESVAMPYMELEKEPGKSSIIKAIILSICFLWGCMYIHLLMHLFLFIFREYTLLTGRGYLILTCPPKVTPIFEAIDFTSLIPKFD